VFVLTSRFRSMFRLFFPIEGDSRRTHPFARNRMQNASTSLPESSPITNHHGNPTTHDTTCEIRIDNRPFDLTSATQYSAVIYDTLTPNSQLHAACVPRSAIGLQSGILLTQTTSLSRVIGKRKEEGGAFALRPIPGVERQIPNTEYVQSTE